jgi:signal transduction histidine kinase
VPVDIIAAAKSAAKELSNVARKNNIKIAVTAGEGLPSVLADGAKLNEVLMNLIGNAVKYNRVGGTVEVVADVRGGTVEVSVKDTGFGIAKDQQARIFEKFFRAPSRETQEIIGTGLGLFITKMLVEKMNGTIRFSSEEGRGSVFAFSLPVAP